MMLVFATNRPIPHMNEATNKELEKLENSVLMEENFPWLLQKHTRYL